MSALSANRSFRIGTILVIIGLIGVLIGTIGKCCDHQQRVAWTDNPKLSAPVKNWRDEAGQEWVLAPDGTAHKMTVAQPPPR